MRPSTGSPYRVFTAFALVGVTVLLLRFVGCSSLPPEPQRTNPLDAGNPITHGDPFHLRAQIGGGGVQLIWDAPATGGITAYAVYRQMNETDSFVRRAEVPATQATYVDSVSNGHTYRWYIVARGANGESSASNVTSVRINMAPVVSIAGGAPYTPTRRVEVTTIASTADRMMLSNDAGLQDGVWQPYQSSVSFMLVAGPGTKTVYVKVHYTDSTESAVVSETIEPLPVHPLLQINSGAPTTASRFVTLNLHADSALDMRIGNVTPGGLLIGKVLAHKERSESIKGKFDDSAAWEPFAPVVDAWPLLTGYGRKTVQAWFRNDFDMVDSAQAAIDPLEVLPQYVTVVGDTVNSNNVQLLLSALHADSMAVSNRSDTASLFWRPYADNLLWNLADSTGSGRSVRGRRFGVLDAETRSVWVWFKNSFAVLSSSVTDNVVVEIRSWVKINGDTAATRSRFVRLTLWSENASEMAISNDSLTLQQNPSWEAYQAWRDWELLTGAGVKTVYAKFRNVSGAVSGIYYDSILPDSLRPTLQIAGGNASTLVRTVTLTLSATGADSMRIWNQGQTDTTAWLVCDTRYVWTLAPDSGTKTVWVEYQSDFGITEQASDAIDPALVSYSMHIVPDSLYVNHTDISLSSAGAGALQMMVTQDNSDSSGGTWSQVVSSYPFELSGADGWKTVRAWYRNEFVACRPEMDSVGLDLTVQIDSLTWWSSSGGDTASCGDTVSISLYVRPDIFGPETGGRAFANIPGILSNLALIDQGNGIYSARAFFDTTTLWNTPVEAAFRDRAGNSSGTVRAVRNVNYTSALLGTYDTPGSAKDVAVTGNYAYVADGGSGLRVVDITNPSAPLEVGFYDTPGSANGVTIAGSFAYVADGGSGLRVVDITNPTAPVEVGFYDTPGYARSVAVSGNFACVADGGSGLEVIIITVPTAPYIAGFYDTPGFAYDVAIVGNYAYVADYDYGLRVVDMTFPETPSEVGFYSTAGYARGVVVVGDYAYVAYDYMGLRVVNISSPAAPYEVGFYDTPGFAEGVAVAGHYAYVADGVSGLQVVNIINPATPSRSDFYDTPGSASGVAVAGNYAYVADGGSGLEIFNTLCLH